MSFNNTRKGTYILLNAADVGYLRRPAHFATPTPPVEGAWVVPSAVTSDGLNPVWAIPALPADAVNARPVWYHEENTDATAISQTVVLEGPHVALTSWATAAALAAAVNDPLTVDATGKLDVVAAPTDAIVAYVEIPASAATENRVQIRVKA